MKILISIVSHNQQELCERLLRSIDKFLKPKNYNVQIVVSENTLIKNSARSENFKVTRINNLRQKGFGANHNHAFEAFDSDVFLIVNPDIILTKKFDLDVMMKRVFQEELDISTPQIVSPAGAIEDYKRADLTFMNVIRRKLFKYDVDKFDWLAGVFLIVNSTSFRKLHGFDTDFFMYVEDCDLSMRARKAGMKIGDIEGFSVVHDARRESTKSFKHFRWHITSLLRYWFLK